ncbi:FkbM family methyltransferase [Calothrix sp. FACHB-1219]|uniref:FkbM family methyltransferase n=1 Tax=unclassified Calothrix TaxID=2619626 RepID=UPI00168693D1|nr:MULTISPECIES: FkbM family methyltransferase [unclassified Calothrix]MBD2201178.1 FkbM family methyltransferase [Calothrix sp. FACHB-168]MBD2215612.1 FkbM family methyltransferase [Calothrix sp. FACHB-1219]
MFKRMMIKMVTDVLHYYGLHIMRYYRIPQSNVNLLSIAIPSLIHTKNNLFFLQVGASDGVTNDPLNPIINKYSSHLKGICLEPLPNVFEKLVFNYSSYSEIKCENSALADCDGDIFMYCPVIEDGSQKSSLQLQVVTKHGFSKIKKIKIKSISLPTLIEKYKITDIDILQVDAEGYDYQVIRKVIDLGFLPSIIHFESLHLDKSEISASRAMLSEKGYLYVETSKDTLAVRNHLVF